MENKCIAFQIVKLKECATFQEGYVNPSQSIAAYFGEEVKWLRATDLNDSFVWDTGRRLSRSGFESAGKAALMFEPDTLAISKSGTIGRIGILKDYMCGNRAVINIRVHKSQFDNRFIFYSLLCRRKLIEELASGSVQANLYCSALGELEIEAPSLEEQQTISHILGTLDDKIELNRQMSATLEEMARALFKSWFIDSDPVRAKAEGRPTGLPPEVDKLFPDSFQESELEDIPKGWQVGSFIDTVDIIGGGTPKTSNKEYWDGNIPWFSVVDAPAHTEVWVIDTDKRITQKGLSNSSTNLLELGTTIISARGTVGRIALVGIPMAMNQSCYGLRSKLVTNGIYNYFSTKALVITLQQRAHGSVFDTITRDTLAGLTVIIPPAILIQEYEKIMSPVMFQIRNNVIQSRTLAALRDTLLPKLISGELPVENL